MSTQVMVKGLPLLGPADVEKLTDRWPDKAGLVLLTADGLANPEGVGEALRAVVARYPDNLWSGVLDIAMFPTMTTEYAKRSGADAREFEQWLPLIGIVRGKDLLFTLSLGPVFFRGRPRLRHLTQVMGAFAYKFGVAYVPKPKTDGDDSGKPVINREKSFKVSVKRKGKPYDLSLYEGENLLDGALERGVELEYSCKQGKCDSCTVRVVKGGENLTEPTQGEKNVLGELLEQGKRLSCQAYVKGPVEIEQ